MQTSIEKLNSYGFKNGIDGLATMVRKSQEFRTSIEESFKIADKVLNPEGALELTSNLQVLGGAIGDFNDPLKLMYMATNNVEGLQDALIGAAQSLATYNTEQGRFEITGVNLRRAKEMATQLGISYDELAKGAIAAAERSSASIALLRNGLNINEKDKEFLTNIAGMEGGQMVIKVPESLRGELGLGEDGKLALADLNEKQKEILLQNQKAFEKLKPDEIAREQLTEIQQISRNISVITQYARVRAVQALGGISTGLGLTGEVKKLREYLNGKVESISTEKPNLNFSKDIEEKTRTIKGKVENYIQNPEKLLDKAIEKGKKLAKDAGISQTNIPITKDDIKNAFVEAMTITKYGNNNKIENNISLDGVDPRGYLSDQV